MQDAGDVVVEVDRDHAIVRISGRGQPRRVDDLHLGLAAVASLEVELLLHPRDVRVALLHHEAGGCPHVRIVADEAVDDDHVALGQGRVLSGTGPDVLVPVGDDAAVVRGGAGDLVLTADALVEGTHFDRAMSRPRDIGYKAIAASISDIAAMAASPRYALCALTLSDDVDAGWAMELFGGMREAADEFACTLVGGNLARGPEVT